MQWFRSQGAAGVCDLALRWPLPLAGDDIKVQVHLLPGHQLCVSSWGNQGGDREATKDLEMSPRSKHSSVPSPGRDP